MRRRQGIPTLLTLVGLSVGAALAPASARSGRPGLELRRTGVGTILVTSRGFTV